MTIKQWLKPQLRHLFPTSPPPRRYAKTGGTNSIPPNNTFQLWFGGIIKLQVLRVLPY